MLSFVILLSMSLFSKRSYLGARSVSVIGRRHGYSRKPIVFIESDIFIGNPSRIDVLNTGASVTEVDRGRLVRW